MTDLARLRGESGSMPRATARWYENNCNGIILISACTASTVPGTRISSNPSRLDDVSFWSQMMMGLPPRAETCFSAFSESCVKRVNLVVAVLRHYEDHGHLVVDEGERPVLELTR